MQKVRFGLIGCGRIAPKHVRALASLNEKAELVALCDTDRTKLARLSEQTGIAYQYQDHLQMIRQEKLDVVNVLTWSGNHAAIAKSCMGNVANIIIEKPLALRLEDADELISLSEQTKTKIFVVKQNRYNPPVVALKRALNQGRFGKLLLGTVRVRWCRTKDYYAKDAWRGTWAWDGGTLTNQASHHVDLLTWMMGSVKSVYAKTATFLAPIETEDTGLAMLEFQNGALGIIEATTCARPHDLEGSISILGEKGSVEIAGFAVNQVRSWNFVDPLPEDASIQASSTHPPDVYGFGHTDFMKDVISCIEENRPSMIDGHEGRRSLELINAIYESAERHTEVFLDSFLPKVSRLGRLVSKEITL